MLYQLSYTRACANLLLLHMIAPRGYARALDVDFERRLHVRLQGRDDNFLCGDRRTLVDRKSVV